MKSHAATVPEYLASLPADRQPAIRAVRRVILDNLDPVLVECMQYGVIGYCVPHGGPGGWPHGHHTNPSLPLMYMGLSSQKNDMVVYMLFLLHNKPMRAWFERAWKASGAVSSGHTAKKLHLEVGGMGCCLRFKKVEDLSLEVIAEAMRRMPVAKYLEHHTATLAAMGKGPDGKPLKEHRDTAAAQATAVVKAKRAPVEKKIGKKKAAAKRRIV